ncbi:zinc finger and SCAN domain-containing protein 9-like, partial [Sceloporus undulatus]|uniref:zinc finger and SCAN domain-containing protein 9-like n=1 Tax=Sceloporus undulatus TaxID=8520 RepID=UPI001C4CDAF4
MQSGTPTPPTLVENAGNAPRAGPPSSQEQLFLWFAEQQQLLLQHVSAQQTRVMEQVCSAQQQAQEQLVARLADLWRAPRPDGAGERERGLTWTVGLNPLKLMKMGPQDDVEAFLNTFERVASAAQWPREQWALILTPCLTGPAQEAVDTMSVEDAKDYQKVKETILQTLNISEETYRRRLRELKWKPGIHPRTLGQKVRACGLRWLKPTERSAVQVAEAVLVEQFITALPLQARNWVRCHRPTDLEAAVGLMEAFTAAEESEGTRIYRGAEGIPLRGGKVAATVGRGGIRSIPNMPQRTAESGTGPKPEPTEPRREAEKGGREIARKPPVCFTCGMEGHIRKDCPVMECSWADSWEASQAWRVREALFGEVEEGSEEDEEWMIGPQAEEFRQTGDIPIKSPLQQEQLNQ